MIDPNDNIITFKHKYKDAEVEFKFSALTNLDEMVEQFKRFCLAIGYSDVDGIRYDEEENEDIAILRDRIKNALENLDTNNTERAKEILEKAYNE